MDFALSEDQRILLGEWRKAIDRDIAPVVKQYTDSMIPRLVERNAGLGTSITALNEISTVTPENSTALPAVSIVAATASSADNLDPKKALRKR